MPKTDPGHTLSQKITSGERVLKGRELSAIPAHHTDRITPTWKGGYHGIGVDATYILQSVFSNRIIVVFGNK